MSSVDTVQTTDQQRKKKWIGYLQKFLSVVGLISLISIDQDIIRWSELANWFVDAYRTVSEPFRAFLSRLIGLDIPPLVADILILASVVFAAANVHCLYRRGTFVFWEGLKLFFLEEIRQRSAGHLIRAEDRKFAVVAAYIAIAIAYGLPGYLVSIGYRGEPFFYVEDRIAWFGYWGFLAAFMLITYVDYRVPQDDDHRFRSKWFKFLVVLSIIFLPVAVYRYLSFFLYCVVLLILLAWRLHLYMLAALFVVLCLNEAYLRFIEVPADRPDCLIYSIAATCNGI